MKEVKLKLKLILQILRLIQEHPATDETYLPGLITLIEGYLK